MPTPQYTAMAMHSTSSSNDDGGSDEEGLLAPRPFTLGRTTTANNTTLSSRPIYGRRSKSFDPRINSRVRNEERVPMDVRIRSSSNNSHTNVTAVRSPNKTQRESRRRRSAKDGAGMSTYWSTKYDASGGGHQHDDGDQENNIDTLEVCKESLSPDVADYRQVISHNNDRDQVVGSRSKSSKRRLSYPDDKEEENDHPVDSTSASLPTKKTSDTKERDKVKRRRMKRNNVNDDENIRPNDDDEKNEENLSFIESTQQDEEQQYIPESKSKQRHLQQQQQRRRRRSTITIRTKSNNGNIVMPGSTKKSHNNIQKLRDFAKANNGTATQYKATYHTGTRPIQDKNVPTSTSSGGGGGSNNNNNMIQNGQLIIKETSVTNKGNKGGNSYTFEGWKLPGKKQRGTSIYDSTRPKLMEVSDVVSSAVLTTCAPYLIVDTTVLNDVDAARVRKFVKEAKSGQTPMEFFAGGDDDDEEDENDDESEGGGEGDEEALFGGSMVSEEDNGGKDVGRKVLGDKSNTAGRTQSKGIVQKSSPDMNLSNKYHKARTKSARKKRKRKSSVHISPTEPRKKRMVDSIVRFYVPDSKDGCQKYFGLIEGIGGGCEEEGLSNVTPHRGRLLELPGAVLSGQWETRLVKDKADDHGHDKSLRISLRHESSSLRSLENILTGKDDSPDGHFVSILNPAMDRTHSLIHQGVVLEEEIDVDYDGREQISSNAFIGCVSLVLFEGFLSSSEAIGESRDVASKFLKNCVPSNELQSGRELYGIVGNEHNSEDGENITGMLYPCKVRLDSDHVVLLLHNEEFQVSGIDVIFRPSKEWLRQHPLTEELLDDYMDHAGSEPGEIMKRYIEKNIAKVLKRPSPLRPEAASVVSHDNPVQSEVEIEQCSLGDDKNSDKESHGHGFGGDDQPDFDANNDDLSSVNDPKEDEKVLRLEEESRSLKQRIQRLEEEKRLLAQQIVDKTLVENNTIVKPEEECVMEQSFAVDELADDPVQIEPAASSLMTSNKSKKKAFVDLSGDNDSLFDELTNKQAQIEHSALKAAAEKKVAVRDLFGDNDSLFGVSTKKKINRRKSTGDLSIPLASIQKQNRARHSTGGLPNRRKSLGKAANILVPATTQAALVPEPKSSSQRTSIKQRSVSTRLARTEKERLGSSKRAKATTIATRPTLDPKTTRKNVPSVRTKTKKFDRRSTFPIESRGKLRFSTGTNLSISQRSKGTTSRKKVVVADLFEDDNGSMFGCAAKAPSVKKKASISKSTGPSLTSNDAQSISSLGGGSCSFESLSTQSVVKVPTNLATGDGIITPTQPLFDVYFGKEIEVYTGSGHNGGAVQQVGTQPFFDVYFGQDSSGKDDDELTQYSMQPFHSVYYGNLDDESTLQSITSAFEIPTVSPSLYYFGLNEGIVEELVLNAQPPFFDHYFGQANDEESSTLLWTSAITSMQSPATTGRPPFYDIFYGQESVRSLAMDAEERTIVAKTSWRSWLANCVQFLVIGVLPALLPVVLLISKQNSLPLEEVDVNDIVDETTSSWWSLKPWE